MLLVERNGSAAAGKRLELACLFVGNAFLFDLATAFRDNRDMLFPVGRQIALFKRFLAFLQRFQAASSGHLPVPNPHDAATAIDVAGKVEATLA